MSVCWSEVRRLRDAAMNTFRSIVAGASLLTLPAEAQVHRFENDPVVTVRENFVACDVLSQLQRVMDNPRSLLTGECEPLSAGRRVRIYASRGPSCLYLSGRHDHAVQMDTRESAVEIIPPAAHRVMGWAAAAVALGEWSEVNSLSGRCARRRQVRR